MDLQGKLQDCATKSHHARQWPHVQLPTRLGSFLVTSHFTSGNASISLQLARSLCTENTAMSCQHLSQPRRFLSTDTKLQTYKHPKELKSYYFLDLRISEAEFIQDIV